MNTAEVSGSIRDPSNAVLPGAVIIASHAQTGQEYREVANSAGEYLLAQMPAGLYSVKVEAANLQPAIVAGLALHAGDRLRKDFTLQIGERSDVVTVSVESENLQLSSAEIRDVIGHQPLVELPLKSRQFLDLAMLSPGVVRPPGGTRGDAMQQAGTLVNVLGQRSGHNLYLMDGVSVTDEHFNNLVISPSVDSIEEFNIEKASYTPEFGGKSGAVINVSSRSGSNGFHGSLFEFLRNDVFDARNFFDSPAAPIPPFRQNQFGVSLGGPLQKNKTFFFLNYEGQTVRRSLTQTFSVPTASMRKGDFSNLPTVYDPNGGRQPLRNNQIPAGRLNAVAVALLAQIPNPNLPGLAQNLRATGNQQLNTNQYGVRLDHQFSEKNSVFLRASVFDAHQKDPFGSGVLQESLLPGFGRNLNTHAVNGVANWTHVFNADVLNESRFGFLTVSGGQTSPNQGNPFASLTGLQGVTQNPLDAGYPQVSFGGQFTTMGDPALFTFRKNRDLEYYDNLTWHSGRHTFKFGMYLMHYNLRPVNPNGARGIFSFTPRWTSSAVGLADGNAFADFLLGYPTTAQAGLGRGSMDASTNWAHLYAQDSWRVNSQLELDFGIRYEYNQNMTDADNAIAVIDTSVSGGRFVIASNGAGKISTAANALLPFLPIPYVTSSAAGWNNSLLVPRSLRLAPRVGLAWRLPGGNLKTVVRAGFGIYPNQAAYSIVTNLAQNLPFFVTKTVNSVAASVPSFTTGNALAANTIGTAGGSTLDHDFKIEYNEVFNLSLERELASSSLLSLTYIGSRTVHADSATLLNVPTPGPGAIAPRRQIPQLSQISNIRWNGWATYHALTVALKRRLNNGLTLDANWTWSHSIDDASDPGATLNETNLPQNVFDLSSEKATSSFDHRHRVVVSFIYQLPLARNSRGWQHALLGEWQAGGNFTVQAGAPFTVNIATDQASIGAGPAQRPNISNTPNDGPKNAQKWFDTSVFSLPSLYTFGNAPRNAVLGPGLQALDLSLVKNVRLTETAKLELRGEAYNLFNRTNFNIPNRMAFTANFGSISSAQDSRQFQMALKLVF